jgi:hypothetical protein
MCFLQNGQGRQGRTPDASCESGQAFEKAQNGNGRLLEKVGVDLGLAPRPLGFGAASVWGWRHVRLGLAARVWDRRDRADSQRDKSGQGPAWRHWVRFGQMWLWLGFPWSWSAREHGRASDHHFGSAGCCVCKYSWTFFGASARFTAAAMAGSGLRIGGTA